MDLGLDGARVLVTGGASNIGRSIVHGFAAEHARIVIADIDATQSARVRLEALERGAADVETVVVDLTDEDAPERVVAAAVARWGGLDVLVNNAGLAVAGFLAEDTDRARWQRMVELNLYGAIACTQAAVAAMRDTGRGAIVFVASDAAFGQIRQGVYGATKAAMIALARTAAKEHGRHGIRANVVCPGLVIPDGPDAIGATSLWAGDPDAVFDERQRDYMIKGTPLRRLTDAADVAHAVVWLASDTAARQVTGQVISVSGGYTMP